MCTCTFLKANRLNNDINKSKYNFSARILILFFRNNFASLHRHCLRDCRFIYSFYILCLFLDLGLRQDRCILFTGKDNFNFG